MKNGEILGLVGDLDQENRLRLDGILGLATPTKGSILLMVKCH